MVAKIEKSTGIDMAISNAKILIHFQIKYTEAILSNSTRKLLWFEIAKMLTAAEEKKYCAIYYNFLAHFRSP